jgi:hypothetical protein
MYPYQDLLSSGFASEFTPISSKSKCIPKELPEVVRG